MKVFTKTALASAILGAALMAPSAQAGVVINKDYSTVVSIPGLTGFSTTGAMMNGLDVTATFKNGFSQTLNWATTGSQSGGVTGTGWGLSLSGDTFSSDWKFDFFDKAFSDLVSLVLDGSDNFTVFDASEPNTGTPGSAQGLDFAFDGGRYDAVATYSKAVRIGSAAVVGDLFQVLTINMADSNPSVDRDFKFVQDTDNDSRYETPEPGTLALLGLALAAVGATTRRRKSA